MGAAYMAPGVGIEPTISRLTGERCTAQLPRIMTKKNPSLLAGVRKICVNRNLAQRDQVVCVQFFQFLALKLMPESYIAALTLQHSNVPYDHHDQDDSHRHYDSPPRDRRDDGRGRGLAAINSTA